VTDEIVAAYDWMPTLAAMIDLMQADLTAGWVIGAAMGPLVALQMSAA